MRGTISSSVHWKFGLIRRMAFGGSGLFRGRLLYIEYQTLQEECDDFFFFSTYSMADNGNHLSLFTFVFSSQ